VKRRETLILGLSFATALIMQATIVAAGPAPLAKVATSTGTSFSAAFGSCPPPGPTCDAAKCNALQFSSGTVVWPSLGRSSISGCILSEMTTVPNGTGGGCDPASGTVTVTGAGGSITLGLGGWSCDVAPGSLAPNEAIGMNLIYVVTGGTGKYTAASGVGNFAGSVITPGDSGQFSINGTFAAH